MPLQPKVTFEPLDKWGMDFIGPIDPPSNKKKNIIMCTDYLTMWAETKAIKVATEEKVVEFLREKVFYKFGYPRELVTDQGNQFTSNKIEDLLSHHKIKHRTSTPYHTQANGQVEVTNRALEGILTKMILIEDLLQNLRTPITWSVFRGIPVEDGIKALAYDVSTNVNEEEVKKEEEDTKGDEDVMDEEGDDTEEHNEYEEEEGEEEDDEETEEDVKEEIDRDD
eukprot:PITA_34122